jgi:hypothetical protein
MKQGGGGLLIFGIPILSVEHDPLELFGEAKEFAFGLGFLDALQAVVLLSGDWRSAIQ